jgi:hypothetical protein
MHDDDGMLMTIRYYCDDERATPDSRDTIGSVTGSVTASLDGLLRREGGR